MPRYSDLFGLVCNSTVQGQVITGYVHRKVVRTNQVSHKARNRSTCSTARWRTELYGYISQLQGKILTSQFFALSTWPLARGFSKHPNLLLSISLSAKGSTMCSPWSASACLVISTWTKPVTSPCWARCSRNWPTSLGLVPSKS